LNTENDCINIVVSDANGAAMHRDT
jgi:hypothetical protein